MVADAARTGQSQQRDCLIAEQHMSRGAAGITANEPGARDGHESEER